MSAEASVEWASPSRGTTGATSRRATRLRIASGAHDRDRKFDGPKRRARTLRWPLGRRVVWRLRPVRRADDGALQVAIPDHDGGSKWYRVTDDKARLTTYASCPTSEAFTRASA